MYNLDDRQRVMKVKAREGLTYPETRHRFGVGMRTLFKWNKKIEPQRRRNKPATKIDMEALRRDVVNHPHQYQYERAQMFGVSTTAIFYGLKDSGSALKKRGIIRRQRQWNVYSFKVGSSRMSV
jgi:transposase